MSMLDGVSQCWWLSEDCVVNWDAWAAVGTVAAVFAAVLAPSIQRALVRRKANALFALAFRGDIINVRIRLESIRDAYPMRDRDGAAWAVETLLAQNDAHREDFLERAKWLDILTSREVDLTRWPAVDLDLAAKVVLAMEAVRHFQSGAIVLAHPGEDRNWENMLDTIARVLDQALVDVIVADDATVDAMKSLPRKTRVE